MKDKLLIRALVTHETKLRYENSLIIITEGDVFEISRDDYEYDLYAEKATILVGTLTGVVVGVLPNGKPFQAYKSKFELVVTPTDRLKQDLELAKQERELARDEIGLAKERARKAQERIDAANEKLLALSTNMFNPGQKYQAVNGTEYMIASDGLANCPTFIINTKTGLVVKSSHSYSHDYRKQMLNDLGVDI